MKVLACVLLCAATAYAAGGYSTDTFGGYLSLEHPYPGESTQVYRSSLSAVYTATVEWALHRRLRLIPGRKIDLHPVSNKARQATTGKLLATDMQDEIFCCEAWFCPSQSSTRSVKLITVQRCAQSHEWKNVTVGLWLQTPSVWHFVR